jgi:hypothetical protein
MLLDFTPEVNGLLSQPFWLFWEEERGKRVSHAPDYFARCEDGRGLVVDCRPLDRIDARSAAKFEATRTACVSAGWGYRVVGEVDAVRMANVRWLAGYRHPRHGVADGVVERCCRCSRCRRPWWGRPRWRVIRSRCCRWSSICSGRGGWGRICRVR